jgi:hypothetical protein
MRHKSNKKKPFFYSKSNKPVRWGKRSESRMAYASDDEAEKRTLVGA